MVLFTAAALIIGGITTYFTVSAVSTLAHWIAVGGGFTVFAGITYNLIESDNNYLGFFDGELFKVLSAGLIGGLTGFVSYRLFESLLASLGWISALVVVVLLVASFIFSPAIVFEAVMQLVGGLADILGGE